MSIYKIAENVYGVGVQDFGIRVFHGYETPFGATYNAYLILDEQVTLIDTVKAPFSGMLIDNIRSLVDPSAIDNVIVNHIEPDHSGALPDIVSLVPNARVFCTAAAKKGLLAYYKKQFNWQEVKTGDFISTGKFTFSFSATPMVHWPDNMMTYMPERKILFSNDAFGQHIACFARFDDELGVERILERSADYYANIVLPFGAQVQAALKAASALNIKVIAPSHGMVWRSHTGTIVEKYAAWARNETDANRALVIYDTMWGTTEKLAYCLSDEYDKQGRRVELLPLKSNHISAVMAKLLEARYISIGSSTLNRGVLPTVAGLLSYMRGLAPKGREGIPFGAYGWSGESAGIIAENMNAMGWSVGEPVKCIYNID